jgi:protein-L-isoaspartate(D-aspartate) O-methyltransferase
MTLSARTLVEGLSRHPELEDRRVLDAIGRVPRDAFVPKHLQRLAWADRALPLAHDATISQPYVVAFMTISAGVEPVHRVLEVGTGSGYHAAVLAELGAEVYTVEYVEALAREAAERLDRLGYGDRVHVRHGDGRLGWPEAAPFDAILVTAAADEIPEPLFAQLSEGGRLVIPLGDASQLLKVFVKVEGGLEAEAQVPVRFVPLRRLPGPPAPRG